MKRTITAMAFLAATAFVSTAQKIDPKHTNWYATQTVETPEYRVEIVDVWARMDVCKMKLKVYNKTSDYLLFKYGEVELSGGSGQIRPKKSLDLSSNKGVETIEPKENENVVFTFDGSGLHQDEFKLMLNGFTKFSAKGTDFDANDFNLPANANEFTAGPFSVNLKNVDKETALTAVRFEVAYKSDDKHVGIIEANKAVCRTSKGQEYARANRKDKTVILFDGQNDKFNLYYEIDARASGIDMQFDNMSVIWKDCFRESELVPVAPQSVGMKIDLGLTAGKNR